MAIDKVKPLKIETPTDGTETDMFPTEVDVDEDYLATKGLAIENLETHTVDRVGDDLRFQDVTKGFQFLKDLLDAENEDFDPMTTDLLSLKTGPAIRELRAIINLVASGTIYRLQAFYNGNASTGRYLEIFFNTGSDEAPEVIPVTAEVVHLTLSTNNTSGSFTVGVFETGDLVTPITSITLGAGVDAASIGVSANLATLDELAFRVTDGTRSKPRLTVFINTGQL